MTAGKRSRRLYGIVFYASLLTIPVAPAFAQSLSFMPSNHYDQVLPRYAPQEQPGDTSPGTDELPAPLQRQVVPYQSDEAAGTIIIDTAHTFLYLTLGDGKAMRYGIGVGREGFTWSGVESIARKAEWPDWIPPAEMVARQPYLPRWVGGGPGNPLGARALYLGNTQYRIHGTNDPTTIGKRVSSGCIRLRNEDVMDLYNRVDVGTKVIVLPNAQRSVAVDAGQVALQSHARGADYHPQTAATRTSSTLSGIY
jgi:lipoprotein-anchoring transpeptidase ErfK/SrfK